LGTPASRQIQPSLIPSHGRHDPHYGNFIGHFIIFNFFRKRLDFFNAQKQDVRAKEIKSICS
jgi:hypothetical protein